MVEMSPTRQFKKPNFEERTDKVVNRYSYSLPKKSLSTLQRQTFRSKVKHLGKQLIE